MRVNKYFPFAFVYFFVNAVGLPLGLLYTMLLTPLLYVWVILKGKKEVLLKFFVVATPFVISHLINGVDLYLYARSFFLFLTVYIFCYAFYALASSYSGMEGIFRKLMVSNFILTLIALVCLFTSYRSVFWGTWEMTFNDIAIDDFQRLDMFSYEPSHYATLLVPIFGFYFMRFVLRPLGKRAFIKLLMITIPLVLSFSVGVIGGISLAIAGLFLANVSRVMNKRILYSITALAIIVIVALLALLIYKSDNAFFVRVQAIMVGQDGSANGRTYEAFYLADIIANMKSFWWGIGPGQLKVIGDPIIKSYYDYPPEYGQVSIPNAFAETIALFGYVGAAIRLLVELYLFYSTKVTSNYYRTLLFLFIFVYQFTGSFTTNLAEYVIWILAFTNVFPEFDKVKQVNYLE